LEVQRDGFRHHDVRRDVGPAPADARARARDAYTAISVARARRALPDRIIYDIFIYGAVLIRICVQSSAEEYILKRQGEDTKGEHVKSYCVHVHNTGIIFPDKSEATGKGRPETGECTVE
jgi:hypothetical protein